MPRNPILSHGKQNCYQQYQCSISTKYIGSILVNRIIYPQTTNRAYDHLQWHLEDCSKETPNDQDGPILQSDIIDCPVHFKATGLKMTKMHAHTIFLAVGSHDPMVQTVYDRRIIHCLMGF